MIPTSTPRRWVRPSEVAEWIATNNVRILNVAGNRKSTTPEIGARVVRGSCDG